MIPITEISISALAYLGDCVIELQVRKQLVHSGISHSGDLNRASLHYVKASSQSRAMQNLLPVLSAEETQFFKRGRNSGHLNVPKTATIAEYRNATGMEVLFGYLFYIGNHKRIEELFALAYPNQNTENEENEEKNNEPSEN